MEIRGVRNADTESGAALVEFALVLPLLLIMLLGILDFARALNYWIDQTHLANVAARWAVVNKNPGPGGSIEESVRLQANTAELRDGGTSAVPNPVQISICYPDGANEVGDPVEATATVTYNWLPFIAGETGIASSTFGASATMRLETSENDSYTPQSC